jgi:hypothetical protein
VERAIRVTPEMLVMLGTLVLAAEVDLEIIQQIAMLKTKQVDLLVVLHIKE